MPDEEVQQDEKQDGSNAQGDVLNSPEVQAALDAARKEAKAQGYQEGQSASDKGNKAALEKARQEAASKDEALRKLEAERIANLPPDEKQAAMLEEVYKRLSTPQGNQEPSPKEPDPNQDNTEPQNSKAQERLAQVLKNQGLNPDDYDMSSTENFIKSLVNRKADESDESEDTEEKPEPVDTSTNASVGVGENEDLDDVFRRAFRRKHRN